MKNSLPLFLKLSLCALPFLLFFPLICYGSEKDITANIRHYISPDQQLEFAEAYFNKGNFKQAIIEYERFIFFFPEDARTAHVQYQIARAYFNDRQYQKALGIFKSIAEKDGSSERAIHAYFDISDCYLQLKDYQSSVKVLDHITDTTTDDKIKDRALYQSGWVFIENHQWETSKAYFHKISIAHQTQYQVDPLLAAIETADNLPGKNPALAGILSVVPGGGYLYCNRPKDAFMAFLLNGGLIWAAVEAFENDSPALGAVISFVEVGFYAGNIYGGITSAHKYNQNKKIDFIDTLKQNHKIRLSVNPANHQYGIEIKSPF